MTILAITSTPESEHLMADTIFKRIISHEIPCHKVYEDEQVLAFLDVSPIAHGHTLVIPKEAAESLAELSEDAAAAIGRVLPRICRAVMQATGTSAYNVLQNNGALAHQAVAHVHFHIIPRPDAEHGLGIDWPATSLDKAEGTRLAQAIAALV
jgi:histidine triad (HIT) family protein